MTMREVLRAISAAGVVQSEDWQQILVSGVYRAQID
jgi:hypothetical protein